MIQFVQIIDQHHVIEAVADHVVETDVEVLIELEDEAEKEVLIEPEDEVKKETILVLIDDEEAEKEVIQVIIDEEAEVYEVIVDLGLVDEVIEELHEVEVVPESDFLQEGEAEAVV